jgi:hypothetical protein
VSFGIGALLALSHPAALGVRALARGRAVTALFAFLVVWPCLAFPLTRAPAWAVLYAFDPRHVPAAALLAVSLLSAALVSVGYEAGLRMVAADRRARLAFALGPLAVAATAFVTQHERALTVATWAAWSRGDASPGLFETAFGAAVLVGDVLVAIAFAVTFRALAPPSARRSDGGSIDLSG